MGNPTPEAGPRGLALLSLDSGQFENLSCLSQLFILRENLRTYEADNDLDEDSVKAYEVFDLIVGTGSGGLVACLLGPLRMSASQAIEAYMRLHAAVFSQGKISNQERSHRLQDALQALIEEHLTPEEQATHLTEFSKIVPGCMIVVTALPTANIQYSSSFRTFRGRRSGAPPCTLAEALLSTLAFPNLFSGVSIKQGFISQSFRAVDSVHCCPLEVLVEETQGVFRKDTAASVALIVSIGAGGRYGGDAEDSENSSTDLASSCHLLSEHFGKSFQGHPEIFVRFNFDGFLSLPGLSGGDIMSHTLAYMRNAAVAEKLDKVVDCLNERKGHLKVTELLFPKVGRLDTIEDNLSHVRDEIDHSVRKSIIGWLAAGYSIEDELATLSDSVHHDSGKWLIESPEMLSWLSGQNRLFFVKGPPGCGKTILAFIVNRYLRDDLHNAAFPIFIKYSANFTVEIILSRFAVQLLHHAGPVPSELRDLYDRNRIDIQVLTNFIKSTLESFDSPTFLVLDALDEFNSSSQNELVMTLLDLSPRLHLFITSRHIPQHFQQNCFPLTILLESSNQADLESYIKCQLDCLPFLKYGLGSLLVEYDVKKASNGIFLLAYLHTHEIKDCRSLMRAQHVAACLPTTPHERYHLSIERLHTKPFHDCMLAFHTLMWVWAAKRPLTLGELCLAVASSTEDLANQNIRDAVVPESILLALCDGLVITDNNYFEFVHLTLREYLNDYGPEIFEDILPTLGPGCLGFLNASRPPAIISEWSDMHRRYSVPCWTSIDHQFFYYCAIFWGEHARGNSGDFLKQFLYLLKSSPRYSLCARIHFEYEPGHHWLAEWSPRYTPLHWAVSLGLEDCVKYLVQGSLTSSFHAKTVCGASLFMGADPRDDQGQSPLSLACQHGHAEIVQFLLAQETVDVNSQDDWGISPLSWACRHSYPDIVQLLLNVNACDKKEQSPLCFACDNANIVRLLLTRETLDINSCGKRWPTLLIWACQSRHTDIVHQLLNRSNLNPNVRDTWGDSALLKACARGDASMVRLLLTRIDIDINACNKSGDSPLLSVCIRGHAEIVSLLLTRDDINVNIVDSQGNTSLALACMHGHTEVVEQLLARSTLEVNTRDEMGVSPLIWACKRSNADIVRLLISREDLDVNICGLYDRSPLFRACEWGQTDIAQILLSNICLRGIVFNLNLALAALKSLNVNACDQCGRLPLIKAYDRGHSDIVHLLLARDDIDVNACDEAYARNDIQFGVSTDSHPGNSLLAFACRRGSLEVVRLLLDREDVDVNACDDKGDSPLVWACDRGDTDIVKLLLTRGTLNINAGDSLGNTPLMLACRLGHTDIVQSLFSRSDLDINATDQYGKSAFAWALERGRSNIVQMLSDKQSKFSS
ncbi:ankyrin repeat-containing domain protein [Flagelloscypha sp. PMI_526]|nr:ankyrin repeat-containing domain protein [Flagelloscypha sp. PMI_526]